MKEKDTGRDPNTGKFTKGNVVALRHGIHSMKNVPSVKGARALTKYLNEVKASLELATPELNVKKAILINQVLKCEEKLNLIDMWVRKTGILRPDRAKKGLLDLQPALTNCYLGFMKAQRQALLALGIDSRESEKILTPLELAEKIDSEEKK